MSNSPYIPFLSLQQMAMTLGFNWQQEEYFFCQGEFQVIDNTLIGSQDFFGIMLCTDGEINLTLDDVSYNLTQSTLLIARPSSIVHVIKARTKYKGILLFVGRNFLLKNIVNADLTRPFRKLQANEYNLIKLTTEQEKTLIDVYRLIDKKRNSLQTKLQLEIIRSLFLVFVCEVAELFLNSSNIIVRSTRNEEITEAFFMLLADPITITHTTSYFAYQLNITTKHLIQAVKNVTGQSPGKFINKKIISTAKNFLENPQLSLIEISEKLGFSEQASFSKFFKKQTGITPSAFRAKE